MNEPKSKVSLQGSPEPVIGIASQLRLLYFPQVDLRKYTERHEFNFDAVLDEGVSNDEVGASLHVQSVW